MSREDVPVAPPLSSAPTRDLPPPHLTQSAAAEHQYGEASEDETSMPANAVPSLGFAPVVRQTSPLPSPGGSSDPTPWSGMGTSSPRPPAQRCPTAHRPHFHQDPSTWALSTRTYRAAPHTVVATSPLAQIASRAAAAPHQSARHLSLAAACRVVSCRLEAVMEAGPGPQWCSRPVPVVVQRLVQGCVMASRRLTCRQGPTRGEDELTTGNHNPSLDTGAGVRTTKKGYIVRRV
ncbi:unnamed protein product [Vitrella brassicaformis CCMP3155]|uniref:Uncharacterized protein n=1 Tax=Vitrella brassicaformis (strain CCMP3155) TaxID=1169540 RepID=A0A0G4FGB2_VITBC|nr:unnamed protein product [Vitrella brassicaformis CCMP3155]|eukprot:CEM11868.1 unnamed protein product [Vitrella brassicaformis CCMP3155]